MKGRSARAPAFFNSPTPQGYDMTHASYRAPKLLNALAINYMIKGQEMPARSTLRQRQTFARGAGLPELQSAVMAMHDRAASLANALGSLIAQSGDPRLAARAEGLIEEWNQECEAFFKAR